MASPIPITGHQPRLLQINVQVRAKKKSIMDARCCYLQQFIHSLVEINMFLILITRDKVTKGINFSPLCKCVCLTTLMHAPLQL